jgi:hypothetical protein
MDSSYLFRTSDLVTGMLYLGYHVGAINKTQACYFKITFLLHLRLCTSCHQHESEAFTGPDSLAMTVNGVVFGKEENMAAGAYDLENVRGAEDYNEWLSFLLYRCTTVDDSDYQRRGETYPSALTTAQP